VEDQILTLETATHDPARDSALRDALLVERMRNGEQQAFEELLTAYDGTVYNLVSRLMVNPADTADVVQEVFLKVFRNLHQFRGQSTLKTWIYRIAVNECWNYRRWLTRHVRNEVGLGLENDEGRTSFVELTDPCPSPFKLASDQETRQRVEDALQRLKPVYRTAVVLRDIEDLGYDEIAEILQISLGTVKSRILRGRHLLKNELMGDPEVQAAQSRWNPLPAKGI
jgi:RNA polymerase sigma-70 factor, ECF subfamily